MRLKFLIITLSIFCASIYPRDNTEKHPSELKLGLRLQHTYQLYTENGFSFEVRDKFILNNRLGLGFTYITSRLGTAFNSNAIKQDHFLAFASYYFMPEKKIQPAVRLNTGIFHANYEFEIFNDLPNNSLLLSVEPGIIIKKPINFPIDISCSFGYNLITGDGRSGGATVYPLFYQFTLFYRIH